MYVGGGGSLFGQFQSFVPFFWLAHNDADTNACVRVNTTAAVIARSHDRTYKTRGVKGTF